MNKNGLTACLAMFFFGSLIFVFFGDFAQYGELTGLTEYIIIRVHFFGLFFGTIGLFGVIRWCCEQNLIYTHKTNSKTAKKQEC